MPTTEFTGLNPTPPESTILSRGNAHPVTIDEVVLDRTLKVSSLQKVVAEAHPAVNLTLSANRGRSRSGAPRG